ncbi:MAG TPA: DUF6166 domain-containing protein [Longimicrobium sp.]|nr:DUF6166 domain-containing protein [Longimicrobium sp.]
MDTTAMLQPADYVWLPILDGATPEPPPAGADGIRAISLGRHVAGGEVHRTVIVETPAGFAPLALGVHLHGDVDEGWAWGWRGSAPLNTALNVLLNFVHPKAAWRLQWAFCDAFLRPLPTLGGTLAGDDVRAWLRRNAWIGLHRSWEATAEADREGFIAASRRHSRSLSPRARAERVVGLITSGTGGRTRADDSQTASGFDSAFELARAAAFLDGAPAEQRWATLGLLAGMLPPPGSPGRESWRQAAAPATPGLPAPAAVAAVREVWSRLVGLGAPERARALAEIIRDRSGTCDSWRLIPQLAYALGAGDSQVTGGISCLAGDPVMAVATLRALEEATAANASLREDAARLGLTHSGIAECTRHAHALHVDHLRAARRAAEDDAAAEMERVRAAEAMRLPRGRSHRPPPASETLRDWALDAPLPLLMQLVRAARGPAGPLQLRAVLHASEVVFPDPPGTVAATLAWTLEEGAPRMLDAPAFLIRGDGLPHTPPSALVGAGVAAPPAALRACTAADSGPVGRGRDQLRPS